MTDITEHPTREDKVYCVVLDAWSRKVVGWSIDRQPTAAMVNAALGMAIDQRQPTNGALVHSGAGSQGGFKWSSQRLDGGGVGDDDEGAAAGGAALSGTDPVPGPTHGCLASRSRDLLGSDRDWREDGRRCGGVGRVISRRVSMVPPRWRREPLFARDGVGSVSVLRGA